MTYVILDSSANLVESFDRESEARKLLEAIVRADPESAGDYALIGYDDAGQPLSRPIIGSDLGVLA
jgi:hypothetical protein